MKASTILKIIGLLPIGLMSLIYLVFGIGESSGGWVHIVQFVIAGLFMWLCWDRPLWGGILLLALTLLRILALIPELFLRPPGSVWNPGLFLLIIIPAILGGLFLFAGLLERGAASAKLT